MPTSFRDQMKRKMDQADSHVEKAAILLQEVAEGYADGHPEIVEQYKTTWTFLQQGRAIIQMLRRTY